jgi:hypothetical protein
MLRILLVIVFGAAACTDEVASPGGCSNNSECAGGQICSSGACVALCNGDGECAGGEICANNVCAPGQRTTPNIAGVDGDGTELCLDTPTSHCIVGGIVVTGDNLDGADFTLGSLALIARTGRTDTRVELDLYDARDGVYTLTARNAAGSDQQEVQLLQGPPGENFTPTANQLVDSINTASNTINILRVPHTHDDVAVHTHDEYMPASGGSFGGNVTINGDVAATGAVRIGATTAACTGANAGALRFDTTLSTLYACDGGRWVALYRPRGDGTSAQRAAESCKAILDDGFSTGSKSYWLRAKNAGDPAFEVYCDMTTQGGGWTLIAKLDGQSSVMNRMNTAQWRDGTPIGVTTNLNAENALNPSYQNVAFSDVMIRSIADPAKNLGWRHPRTFTSMFDIVRAASPIADGGRLFGSVQNLDYAGSVGNHTECPDLRFGFFGFDYFYRATNTSPTNPFQTAGKLRTTGHTGAVVAASRFEITDGGTGANQAHVTNCITDFGFGAGYYDMSTVANQRNIQGHWWGAGNANSSDFNAHALFVR